MHACIQQITVCLPCVSHSLGMQTVFTLIPSLFFLSPTWPLAHSCPNPLASVHPALPSQSASLPGPSRVCACHLLCSLAGTTEQASEPLLCGMVTSETLLTASHRCLRLKSLKPEFLGWLIFNNNTVYTFSTSAQGP